MTTLLKVQDLHVSFKQHLKSIQAVRGVSFDVYPEETLGIVGESGSGKSVMVKALLKLFSTPSVSIDRGEVVYQGLDLLKLSEAQLRKIRGKEIGMIFQDPMTSLNPTMKIGDQIAENLLQHDDSLSYKDSYHQTLQLLHLVGISDPELRFNQYPHELSGGMRQRVMIAIAVAPRPRLIIADEPTTALDVTIQAQILQLLKEIQKKTRCSILLITHDLSLVAGFCDKVMVMYAGKIVEKADTESLFEEPKHPYTKRLLESIPRLTMNQTQPLRPIEGSPPDLANIPPGCSFAPRCSQKMPICLNQDPPSFWIRNKSQSNCWLYDPRYLAKRGSQ